jgi:hypothetical protein
VGVALTRGKRARPHAAPGGPGPLTSLRVYVLLLLAFTLGFGIYLWTIQSYYGLGTLISDPSSIRAYTTGPNYLELFPLYGKVLFYVGPLVFALTVIPDLVSGLAEKPRTLRYLIAAFLVVGQAAALQRTNIFVSVVIVVGIALLRAGTSSSRSRRAASSKQQLLGLVALGIVSVLAFQGIAVALGKTSTDDPSVSYAVDPDFRDSQVIGVMHYAASGIPAFSKLAESHNRDWPDPEDVGNAYGDYNPQTWGTATFSAPLKLVPQVQRWEEIAPFTQLPAKTNVYTWLEPWYRDFRAPGAILGALAIGMLIGVAADRAARSSRALVLGGLLIGLSGMATFVNRYSAVMTIILYLLIWWLGRRPQAAARRSAPEVSAPGLRAQA